MSKIRFKNYIERNIVYIELFLKILIIIISIILIYFISI